MTQALLLQWTYENVGAVSSLTLAILGMAMIARDMRADQKASLQTANWIWDAARVEDFLQWERSQSERKAVEESDKMSGAAVDENDLLFFDLLQLRELHAKEIEAILQGSKHDRSLMKDTRTIEASISRRRWRLANDQPTPGVVRRASKSRHSRSDSGIRTDPDECSLQPNQTTEQPGRKVEITALTLSANDQNHNVLTGAGLPLSSSDAAIKASPPIHDDLESVDGRYFDAFAAQRGVSQPYMHPAVPVGFGEQVQVAYVLHQNRFFDAEHAMQTSNVARNVP